MYYLYGSKKGVQRRLTAMFGSEQQLLAYVRWATLKSLGENRGKFEQGSVLASYEAWEQSVKPLTSEDASAVPLSIRRKFGVLQLVAIYCFAFSDAFRRWLGCWPSSYREHGR